MTSSPPAPPGTNDQLSPIRSSRPDDDASIDEVRIASRQFITAAMQSDADLVFCWPEHEPE